MHPLMMAALISGGVNALQGKRGSDLLKSTIRDTAGMFINVMGGDPYYNISVNGNNEYLSESIYTASKILTGVEFRANNLDSFDNLEKNSMDFYASVKSLYLQDRQLKIENIKRGNIQIIYNDEGDWEEIDTK